MKTELGLIIYMLLCGSAFSEAGVWVKGELSAQLHTRCLAKWECQPKESVLHGADTVVMVTKPRTTFGICHAVDGPTDSCNMCAASPPTAPCEWRLEKKSQ